MKAKVEHSPTSEDRYKRMAQTSKLRILLPQATKPILPDGYREDLIKRLDFIPGLEVTPNPSLNKNPPEILYLNPRETYIYIDYNSQRELEARDLSVLKKIAQSYDWGKFKVPSLIRIKEWGNKLFCVDGQKQTLAALYNNLTIPFCITDETPESFVARQATGFIGINFDRTAPSSAQLFPAQYFTGNETDIGLAKILQKYKIKPVHNFGGSQSKKRSPLETTCITVLRKLYDTQDKKTFEIICKIVEAVRFCPLERMHMGALNLITYRIEPKEIDIDRMSNAILSITDSHAKLEAVNRARKAIKKTNISGELANIYMERYKMGAKALNAASVHIGNVDTSLQQKIARKKKIA